MIDILRRIETFISMCERVLIIALIILIITLSGCCIIVRNIGFSIAPWVGDILSFSVLWIAFLGASLAARYDRHVNLNIFPLLFSNKPVLKRIITAFASLFVVFVAIFLCIGTYNFVRVEYEWGIDIPSLGLKSWIFEVILIYLFAAVSFKYFIRFLEAVKGRPFPEEIEEALVVEKDVNEVRKFMR